MRRLLAVGIAVLLFASCGVGAGPRGRAVVSGRVVSEHNGITVYEDRVNLQGGIVTCVTAKTSQDISVSCDWPD